MDRHKINTETQDKLLANGVDCLEALNALHKEDVQILRLSLGQRRLLERLLFGDSVNPPDKEPALHNSNTPGQTGGGQNGGNLDSARDPLMAGAAAPGDTTPGGLDTDLFLGMCIHGSQKPYYDIVDFLPSRSPYDVAPERQSVIMQREDGMLYMDPKSGKRESIRQNILAAVG